MIREDLDAPLQPHNRRKTGHKIEDEVANWLMRQGVEIIAQNYQTQRGEIDLIGKLNQLLIFFEVRYRFDSRLVSAEESITRKKQLKIIRTAEHYLQYQWGKPLPLCRFDVITVNAELNKLSYNWIHNAFY